MTSALRLTGMLATCVLTGIGFAQAQAAGNAAWPPHADAVVAADGSGQFKSLQAAIFAAPTATRERPWLIYVKAGEYRERLYIQREKHFLHLVGEHPERTVITYDLHANKLDVDGLPLGTFRTATVLIDADDFTAEGLTFENPAGTQGNQALAVRVDGDRVAFRKCRFVGWQDTLLLNRGRQYFEDCFISGHIDFIFGGASAFFERCAILARGNGYITAASTPEQQRHGFVFSRCTIDGAAQDVRTYLGRPWRDFASVAFVGCVMSEVVRPDGWHNWDRPHREQTARYSEHGSTGAGANPEARAAWARNLSAEDARALTSQNVLAGDDGWDPQAEGSAVSASRTRTREATREAPADCPASARLVRGARYGRAGQEQLRLDACIPRGKGPWPAALLVHGGGWSRGDRTEVGGPLRDGLARAGIAWLAIDYRLAPQHHYPAPVEDVETAIRWTKQHAARLKLDPNRLALVGESAGGHLVVMAVVRADESTRVSAVIPFFAPVDLESDTERRGGLSASLKGLFGRNDVDEETRRLLREASPIQHVRSGLPPFLLVHGTADMSVPYEQSTRLRAKLSALGVPCELITIPDGTHGTAGWPQLDPGFAERVVAWMIEHLKP